MFSKAVILCFCNWQMTPKFLCPIISWVSILTLDLKMLLWDTKSQMLYSWVDCFSESEVACLEFVPTQLRGFSKSWHVFFIFIIFISDICAFVLTWCLFVDNSRQTTSSVPWHRAPKYDRKHDLHLTIKWFLFKWSLILCMYRQQVCAASSETTVCSQEGESVKNAQTVLTSLPGLPTLFQANQLRCERLPWHVWLETSSSQHSNAPLYDSRLLVLTRWPNLSLFSDFCGLIINLNSINQTRIFSPLYFNIWTHLAYQHAVHPY